MALVAGLAAIELVMRVVLLQLPVPFLIHLHRDLKDDHPAVYVRLREAVPNLQRREEDPDVGWTFLRSARASGVNEDGEHYDRTTTPEGFYSPDVPSPSEAQLITLGDSFLSTFVVPTPAAWTLRERIGIPVYNLAVGGWGPESYRAAYDKFAARRTHSLVVVFSFINDISDVANWRAWQANPRGMSFMTWIQSENPDGEGNTRDGWLDRHSVAWNLVRFAMRRPAAAEVTPESAPAAASARGDGRLLLTAGQVFAVNDPSAFQPGGSYYPYLQSYFESLERLRLDIEARGARMALVWIPSKERVYLPLLPEAERRQYVTNSSGDIGGLEPIITQFAAQARVPFLDCTEPMIDAARHGERVFFRIDGHLNSRGNALLGELAAGLVEGIRSGTWPELPMPATPLPYRSGPVTVAERLTLGKAQSHDELAVDEGPGFLVRGRAKTQFGYIAQWPEVDVTEPMFIVARGVLRAGGFTLGVLRDGAWAGTMNVTSAGGFDVALPVMSPGRYTVTLAHALPAQTWSTDFKIDELGWSRIQKP